MKSADADLDLPIWRAPDGSPLSCREKIKVLNENLGEIRELAQDALEDAILMGADEAQIRAALHSLVDGLLNPYAAKAPSGKAPSGEGHS